MAAKSAPKRTDPATSEHSPPSNEQQLDRLRVDIGATIKKTFPWLFLITVFIALALIVLVGLGFMLDKTMDATALAASMQVALGMVIGFVCVYLGLMMTWFGIDAAYTFKGSLGAGEAKAEGALKSASPGLLFALAGIVLIAVSLHKRIEYQEGGFESRGVGASETPGENQPRPPGERHVMESD
jgi:hypothetical protein